MAKLGNKYIPIFQKYMYVIEDTDGTLLAILALATNRDEAETAYAKARE